MIIAAHRINKLDLLKKVPRRFGIEIDIRSYNKKIILNHEPFEDGVKLDKFLKFYKHKLLIANIKEAGIEDRVIQLIKKFKIKNYFLLDVEQPFIWTSESKKFGNVAIRFSESENIKNAEQYVGKFKWLWVDTKSKFPINKRNYGIVKKFKSCLVCPERWGRSNDIQKYKNLINKNKFQITAVMTDLKYLNAWEK